jgi:hypothetical protein
MPKTKKKTTRRPRTRAASRKPTPITADEVDELLQIDESGMPPPVGTVDAPVGRAEPPPTHQREDNSPPARQIEGAGSQGPRRSVSFTPGTPAALLTPYSQEGPQAMDVETPEKDKEIRCLVGLLDHQEKVVSEKDAQLRKLRDRVSTLESQRAAMASRARLEKTRYAPRGYPLDRQGDGRAALHSLSHTLPNEALDESHQMSDTRQVIRRSLAHATPTESLSEVRRRLGQAQPPDRRDGPPFVSARSLELDQIRRRMSPPQHGAGVGPGSQHQTRRYGEYGYGDRVSNGRERLDYRVGSRNLTWHRDDTLRSEGYRSRADAPVLHSATPVSLESRAHHFGPDQGKYNPFPPQREDGALNRVLSKIQNFRGQTILAVANKKLKEDIQDMQSDVGFIEAKLIPIGLAFALFKFDLREVAKWSPILTRSAQRKYSDALRREPARTKAKLRGLTENVLNTISIDEEDEEATEAIRADSEQSRDRWRNMMSLTTLPLVRRYWEPLIPGTIDKIEQWLLDIDDDVSEAWRFTRKAIDRVLDEYARQVARGFSRSFGAGAAAILNFELSLQLRSEEDRVRKDAMDKMYAELEAKRKRIPAQAGRDVRVKTECPPEEAKARRRLTELIREEIPNFETKKGWMKRMTLHNHSGSKKWGCTLGCMEKLVAKDLGIAQVRLCTDKNCSRSHDLDSVFPEGIRCLVGKCAASCPSRATNAK